MKTRLFYEKTLLAAISLAFFNKILCNVIQRGKKKKKSQDNFDYPVKKKVYSALLWEKKKKKVYKLPNNRGKINK